MMKILKYNCKINCPTDVKVAIYQTSASILFTAARNNCSTYSGALVPSHLHCDTK